MTRSFPRHAGGRWRYKLSVGVPLLLVLLGATTGTALAHARLVRSDPTPDAILQSSPARMRLWFSEDLNGAASRIIVWDRYRHVETLGSAQLASGDPRQMQVALKPLPPGSYLVLWTSVSAEDGHILRGSFLFSVKVRGPVPSLIGASQTGASERFPDAPGLTSLLAHWLELLAAVCWVGSVAFPILVLSVMVGRLDPAGRQAGRDRLHAFAGLSLAVLLISSAVVLLLQAYSLAGNDWGSTFSTSTWSAVFNAQYGHLWILRQMLALLALILSLVLLWRARRRQLPKQLGKGGGSRIWTVGAILSMAIGLVYLYAFAASGHASAADVGRVGGSSVFSASVFVDWLHFVADALWLGGQAYIALVLIPALRLRQACDLNAGVFLDALNRYSPVAYGSVAVLTFSGAFNGKVQIPSWYAGFHSVYGWALIVKIVLIGLMMQTSAFTVYILRPCIRCTPLGSQGGGASLGRLQEWLAANLLVGRARMQNGTVLMRQLLGWLGLNPVLGAGVLLATSVMFSYPVPVGLASPGPAVHTAQGGKLTASVTLKPGTGGPNQITVRLKDKEGRPLSEAHVTVLTTMLQMPMGTGVVPLRETAPGIFTGNAEMGMAGRWRLELLIYRPSGLTRVRVVVELGI